MTSTPDRVAWGKLRGSHGALCLAVGVLAFAIVFQLRSSGSETRGDFSALFAGLDREVVLLERVDCPYCAATRDLLHSRGVEFTTLDVRTSQDARAFMQQHRIPGVPVTVTRTRYVVGFDRRQLEKMIDDAPTEP